MSNWISVEDKRPTNWERVLLFGAKLNKYPFVGYCNILGEWRNHEQEIIKGSSYITHWQPLPEPPKEDNI